MADGIGYLTPDFVDFGSVTDCRTVTLPLSLWYLVNGALQELTFPENWVMFGTATPEETADFFINVLDKYGKCMEAGTIFASVSSQHDGAILLNGAVLDAGQYPALASVCPIAWWASQDEIELPDMTGCYLTGLENAGQHGTLIGSNEHTLSVNEMPIHSHGYASGGTGAATLVVPDVPTAVPSIGITENEGGGMPHNNRPRSLAIYWHIRT